LPAKGRIGRALAEKSLAQSLRQPSLLALAATILSRRTHYYSALEAANKANELTDWLAWFAGITIEAQRRTLAMIEFLIDKTMLFDRLSGQINERQQKALLRMFREGPEGFKGGMSAGKYSTITGASPATTTRDLAELTTKGALMLHYAVVFFIIALIAAFFGFGGIAVGAAGIAKVLFVVFLIGAVVSFLMSMGRRV